MMRFKQYVSEAYLDDKIGMQHNKSWNTSRGEAKLFAGSTDQIGETHDHTVHKIHKSTGEDGAHDVVYYAKHKASGRIDATINGTETNNAVHIDSMAKHEDGSMKMHHLIHHLVHVHGKMVGASHFSVGGKKVMEKVGEMDGVSITHWKDKKKVTPVDPYSDDKETGAHDRTYVVAHPSVDHTAKAVEFHRSGRTKITEETEQEQHARIHSKELVSPTHIDAAQKHINGSFSMNNHLHQLHDGYGLGGGGMKQAALKDHHMNKRVRETDAIFENRRNHIGEEVHVHTGLSESPHHIVKKEEKRLGQKPRNIHLHLPAYTSTSTNENVAREFANQDEKGVEHILHVRVKADHPAVSLKSSAAKSKEASVKRCESEDEVLLHRGTRLKVSSEPEIEHDKATGRTFHHWFATTDGVSHNAS